MRSEQDKKEPQLVGGHEHEHEGKVYGLHRGERGGIEVNFYSKRATGWQMVENDDEAI